MRMFRISVLTGMCALAGNLLLAEADLLLRTSSIALPPNRHRTA